MMVLVSAIGLAENFCFCQSNRGIDTVGFLPKHETSFSGYRDKHKLLFLGTHLNLMLRLPSNAMQILEHSKKTFEGMQEEEKASDQVSIERVRD